jgi:hypothetical protein
VFCADQTILIQELCKQLFRSTESIGDFGEKVHSSLTAMTTICHMPLGTIRKIGHSPKISDGVFRLSSGSQQERKKAAGSGISQAAFRRDRF